MYQFSESNNKMNIYNHYVLVPNLAYLIKAINIGFKNFCFITSVSNSFQIKNTRMSLEENYKNINTMFSFLHNSQLKDYNIKLYVSCITKCPIEGNIRIHNIVDNLIKLNKLKPNTLCLSDTCGELETLELDYILRELKLNKINISNISLHLHVKQERELEIEKLFHLALDHGIEEFDVSAINTGGCSVTMNKNQLIPNLSYEQYYKFLSSYFLE
jgi:hydroxymethylglutaryl-CoA lyase